MWIKDLGNVQGEKGDTYIPEVVNNVDTGFSAIKWVKKPYDFVSENEYVQPINVPVYVPTYDTETGQLSFTLKTDGNFSNINNTYTIQSVTQVESVFQFQTFTGNIEDINEEDKNSSTFYIENTNQSIPRVYVYDENEEKFINLEGLAFSGYYLKTETYSADEIDQMFHCVAQQQQTIQQLLDDITEISNGNE